LQKTERLSRQAADAGAQLVLFPESFLPAYPRGLKFGTVVGSRSPKGRALWLEYWRNSVEVPGPATERLGRLAGRLNLYLVIGVTERSRLGGTLYCSLLYFAPDGKLLGRHRKLKPTGSERVLWGEGRGDDLQVFETPFGRLGGLICWENYMPLARTHLYQQGIDIYLAPTADQRESWQATLRHIACESRCYVLGCNQFVTRNQYPDLYQQELSQYQEQEPMSHGGSAIISPLGEPIAGPLYGKEDMLYADLNTDEIVKSRMDFDACGHYARPDVFRLDYRKGNYG